MKNRLENYDYSTCGTYFITICTLGKQNRFGKSVGATDGRPPDCDCMQNIELSPCGMIVDEAINNISSVYPALSVDCYVIMPNHIHLLLRVCTDDHGRPMVAPTMSRVVNQLKGYVSRRVDATVWQKSFYDHIIRNAADYEEHRNYIYENPIRWRCNKP